MTITVAARPETSPPSNVVDVSVAAGSVMSSVSVWRTDHNGRNPLRAQPSPGFDSRTVVDYECLYGETVTYDWSATYTDPGAYTTVWAEAWTDQSQWDEFSGSSYTVAAGKVRSGAAPGAVLRHLPIARGKYRVTFASISCPVGQGYVEISHRLTGEAFQLVVADGVLQVDGTPTSIDPVHPVTVDFFELAVVVTGTGGGRSVPRSMSIDTVSLQNETAAALGFQVGAITVQRYGAVASVAETSGPLTLDAALAWLIHPGSPGLSVPLAETDASAAGIIDLSGVANPSNATAHHVLGASTPTPTTTGPRGDDLVSMTVATVTAAESAAVRALLAPDVPVLVQIPPAWELGFNSGFYQVGDSSVERTGEPRSPRRIVTMPMYKVQSPVVDIQNTGWSYAAVAAEFATYGSLLLTFDSYADLAANTRV